MSGTARSARLLEVTSYPPPRAGWGVRVEFLKTRLEGEGHQCIGTEHRHESIDSQRPGTKRSRVGRIS